MLLPRRGPALRAALLHALLVRPSAALRASVGRRLATNGAATAGAGGACGAACAATGCEPCVPFCASICGAIASGETNAEAICADVDLC